MPLTERRRRYWQRTLRVTAVLLAIWFVVTFGVSYFARELDFSFFGWPFSFWVASQGALIVYVLIVAFYAHHMNRLDDERHAAKGE
jgi:putative solute:sodium symporter small subunit